MRFALGAAIALLAASCAPTLRAPEGLDPSTILARHERLRSARETRLVAVRMDATAWIEGENFGRLPALQLDLALAAPDRVRARFGSMFGTALDLMVRGDSLRAYIPPRRLGFELASLEESLGVRLPGSWACRAVAATWRPADPRWTRVADDSLWRAAWLEGSDSLGLALDSRGLPVSVELRAGSGRRLRVGYPAWNWEDGVAWPARIELEEGSGAFRATLRLDRVRFLREPDPLWMVFAIPASAERLDWEALRGALARLGSRP
ncbi:MAG: hypothetical protein ABIS67_14350 [Candidatus Eisenbacteria bacterium]